MSRKYRQQGYQDSDRRDERGGSDRRPARQELSAEERLHRKGMRHAIDREAREVVRCHSCGRSSQRIEVIEAETTCPYCEAALHCCRLCVNFDSAAPKQCRAQIEEAVGDKTKANHCEQYQARMVLDSTGRRSEQGSHSGGSGGGGGGARDAFESLFKR